MISYNTVLSLAFLKKSRFTGSERGMRYSVSYADREGISVLLAEVCPGPFSVDKTKRELFETKEFAFTEEGRKEAVDWINDRYEANKTLYEEVFRHPMRYYSRHHIEDAGL